MTFSTTTDLLPHQELAVAKLLPPLVGALFMDMGTGKSRTLLELAKLRQHKWDKLFWFTPCALRDNVRHQILLHTDIDPSEIVIWDCPTLDAQSHIGARLNIVGIESMSASDRTVLAYAAAVTERSFVVVDESLYIKGNHSKRTQRITAISARCRYRSILTGTPLTQGAVDLYAQMTFLSPKILGYRSFWNFAANHLEYEERRGVDGRKRRTGRIINSHNEDYLAAKIAPYVYQVKKDECLSLPEKLYASRSTSMTPEQREIYEEAKEEILSLDYDDWSPIKIFHLFTSLQTIVCGFWKRPGGGIVEVPHKRIDLLMAALAEIPDGEPVVIWAKYRKAVDQISEALASEYGTEHVCPYQGAQSEAERGHALQLWRSGARFLVATQSIGGHGLTLCESAYSVFYADNFKYSERIQAEDRIHRIGQTRRSTYVTLSCSNSIDDRIATALGRKGNVLDEFQSRVDHYRRERMRDSAISLVRNL